MSAQYSLLKRPGSGSFSPPPGESLTRSLVEGETLLRQVTKSEGTSQVQTIRTRLVAKDIVSVPTLLHLGVLAIYVALVVIWATGLEKNITVELVDASRIQTWINLISHVVMLVFSTAIIAVMQPMATRSPFANLPQSLTTISDKVSAWSGLGSSLVNLYHNISYPATLGNTFLVVIYFSALSGLGISSSFLFDVPTVNETISSNRTTEVGTPSLRLAIPAPMATMPSNFSDVAFDWYRSGVGVGMLIGVNATVYPGLSANRIYDTLSPPMAASSNASAIVGYTDFNVKCGSVTNPSYFARVPVEKLIISDGGTARGGEEIQYPTLLTINHTLGPYHIELSDSMGIYASNLSYAVGRLWEPADVLLRIPNATLVPGVGRNLVLYNIYNETGLVSGSQPILDSRGSVGSPWPVQLLLRDTMHIEDELLDTGLMIQVIGCSLSTSRGQTKIDGTTNLLLEALDPLQGASQGSLWGDWQPDLTQSNELEDTWASMFLPGGSMPIWEDQPVPLQPTQWSCVDYVPVFSNESYNAIATSWSRDTLQNMTQSCHVPTLVEEYLTTQLFGPSSVEYQGTSALAFTGDVLRNASAASALLRTLESALSNATAMTMWSAARASTLTTSTDYVPPSRDATLGSRQLQPVPDQYDTMRYITRLVPTSDSALVTERKLMGRITFNLPSLFAGTALAVVLATLGLYMLISGDIRSGEAPIQDAGLLNLMSLDNSAVASRLSQPSMVSSKARRREGAFLVMVVDGRLVPVDDSSN
ncbi:unnamed protein product [Peniophora sp. CBMAI 1063]|nr:unnamed protein product [Peniophora sp. CBMAI 1063]